MKKIKITIIAVVAVVTLGGIIWAGVDAGRHPSEENKAELGITTITKDDERDNENYYYFENENGEMEAIPKSQTIMRTEGYIKIENGQVTDYIPAEDAEDIY